MKLYIVEADHGRCKIGVTNDFATRIKQLESAGGFKTTQSRTYELGDNARAAEALSHRYLSEYRIRTSNTSTEWFRCYFIEAVAAVEGAIVQLGLPDKRAWTARDHDNRKSVENLVLWWWNECLDTCCMPCRAGNLFGYSQHDNRIIDVSGAWSEYYAVVISVDLLVDSFHWFTSKDTFYGYDETEKELRTRLEAVGKVLAVLNDRGVYKEVYDDPRKPPFVMLNAIISYRQREGLAVTSTNKHNNLIGETNDRSIRA